MLKLEIDNSEVSAIDGNVSAVIGIWLGWATEEVCSGANSHVVAQYPRSGLSIPVCVYFLSINFEVSMIFYVKIFFSNIYHI